MNTLNQWISGHRHVKASVLLLQRADCETNKPLPHCYTRGFLGLCFALLWVHLVFFISISHAFKIVLWSFVVLLRPLIVLLDTITFPPSYFASHCCHLSIFLYQKETDGLVSLWFVVSLWFYSKYKWLMDFTCSPVDHLKCFYNTSYIHLYDDTVRQRYTYTMFFFYHTNRRIRRQCGVQYLAQEHQESNHRPSNRQTTATATIVHSVCCSQ